MKILLYFEAENLIQVSGIGRAFEHQKIALEKAGIEYTTDLNDHDIDILHINTVGPMSEYVILWARSLNKKVVYHAHSTEEDFRDSFVLSNLVAPLYKTILLNFYKSADAIITPTPYSKELLTNYGITLPIYDVSNGIDLTQYELSEAKQQLVYDMYPYLKDKKWIMGVGLPFKRKGILDFVEVAEALPQYEFIWFGELSPWLVPSEINDAIAHPPENCHFPGYVKGDVIQGAFQSADCFFFPSYEETEGIVVLEALASKQQVLVRDIGAYEPWLVDGENCYKGSTNEDFIRLIQDIVEERVPSTIEAGYRVVEERDLEHIGKRLKVVYETVLNK